MPQLVQNEFGYTAMLAGLSLLPGGIVTMTMIPIAGYLTGKISQNISLRSGSASSECRCGHLRPPSPDLSFGYAVWTRMFTAAGLPFLFIPITTTSYAGLKGDTNQAAALINIARNLGGGIGVALVQTSLQQRQQFHQSRLVEHTLPSDIHLQEFIQRATEYFQSSGSSAVDVARKAYALLGQEVLKRRRCCLTSTRFGYLPSCASLHCRMRLFCGRFHSPKEARCIEGDAPRFGALG